MERLRVPRSGRARRERRRWLAWVADTNGGAVVHLQADGSELWRETDFVSPAGVTVLSSDGSVWVADRGLNQVIKLVTAPTVAFSATPIIGYAPLPVTFTDASPTARPHGCGISAMEPHPQLCRTRRTPTPVRELTR